LFLNDSSSLSIDELVFQEVFRCRSIPSGIAWNLVCLSLVGSLCRDQCVWRSRIKASCRQCAAGNDYSHRAGGKRRSTRPPWSPTLLAKTAITLS